MDKVSVRDLRNHGGDVLARVEAGEHLTVTRSGRPVAELRPLARVAVPVTVLVDQWSRLPEVDPAALRADIDAVVDQSW
jgi:prevent-host-death family protein